MSDQSPFLQCAASKGRASQHSTTARNYSKWGEGVLFDRSRSPGYVPLPHTPGVAALQEPEMGRRRGTRNDEHGVPLHYRSAMAVVDVTGEQGTSCITRQGTTDTHLNVSPPSSTICSCRMPYAWPCKTHTRIHNNAVVQRSHSTAKRGLHHTPPNPASN